MVDVLEDNGGDVVAVPLRLSCRADDVLCASIVVPVLVVSDASGFLLEQRFPIGLCGAWQRLRFEFAIEPLSWSPSACWRSSMGHQPLGPAAIVSLVRCSAAKVRLAPC